MCDVCTNNLREITRLTDGMERIQREVARLKEVISNCHCSVRVRPKRWRYWNTYYEANRDKKLAASKKRYYEKKEQKDGVFS